MIDEKFNGWTNRETWAVRLWLTNDREICDSVFEVIKNSENPQQALKEWVEDLRAETREHIMWDDIGSLWRVDWQSIISSFKEEVQK